MLIINPGTVLMSAATMMGQLAAADPDVVDDLFGPMRNIQGIQGSETPREKRIRAVVELAQEMAHKIEGLSCE